MATLLTPTQKIAQDIQFQQTRAREQQRVQQQQQAAIEQQDIEQKKIQAEQRPKTQLQILQEKYGAQNVKDIGNGRFSVRTPSGYQTIGSGVTSELPSNRVLRKDLGGGRVSVYDTTTGTYRTEGTPGVTSQAPVSRSTAGLTRAQIENIYGGRERIQERTAIGVEAAKQAERREQISRQIQESPQKIAETTQQERMDTSRLFQSSDIYNPVKAGAMELTERQQKRLESIVFNRPESYYIERGKVRTEYQLTKPPAIKDILGRSKTLEPGKVYRQDIFGFTSEGVPVEKAPKTIKVSKESAQRSQLAYESALVLNPIAAGVGGSMLRTARVKLPDIKISESIRSVLSKQRAELKRFMVSEDVGLGAPSHVRIKPTTEVRPPVSQPVPEPLRNLVTKPERLSQIRGEQFKASFKPQERTPVKYIPEAPARGVPESLKGLKTPAERLKELAAQPKPERFIYHTEVPASSVPESLRQMKVAPAPMSGIRRFLKSEEAVSYIPTYQKLPKKETVVRRAVIAPERQKLTMQPLYTKAEIEALTKTKPLTRIMPVAVSVRTKPQTQTLRKLDIATQKRTKQATDSLTKSMTRALVKTAPVTRALTVVRPITKAMVSVRPAIITIPKPLTKPHTATQTEISTRVRTDTSTKQIRPEIKPPIGIGIKLPAIGKREYRYKKKFRPYIEVAGIARGEQIISGTQSKGLILNKSIYKQLNKLRKKM